MIRIGLDMDEVLDDFMGAYIKRYGITPSNVITKNVRKLSKDKDFLAWDRDILRPAPCEQE